MEITDPAREYAAACTMLRADRTETGDTYLAKQFNVEPWSPEFFQILFCLSERAKFLMKVVSSLEMDEDQKQNTIAHLQATRNAFNKQSLLGSWKIGSRYLAAEHVNAIDMLSHAVRSRIKYPKLGADEVREVAELTDKLLGWLQEQQLIENDFIRQALIDGLLQFKFRLEKIQWLGWGYTVESLREVVGAYMTLSGATPHDNSDPHAGAVLTKVLSFCCDLYKKLGIAKDASDRADVVLKIYAATQLICDGRQAVAGLIGFG